MSGLGCGPSMVTTRLVGPGQTTKPTRTFPMTTVATMDLRTHETKENDTVSTVMTKDLYNILGPSQPGGLGFELSSYLSWPISTHLTKLWKHAMSKSMLLMVTVSAPPPVRSPTGILSVV